MPITRIDVAPSGKTGARRARFDTGASKAMKLYKIFTNDRDSRRGVPMYSCLKDVRAESPEAALKQCPPRFDAPYFAPAKAITWPQNAQSDDEKAWLKKHVGDGL